MTSSNQPPPLAATTASTELADAMPHIVWTQDAAGVPTYFNRYWTEYTGLSFEETLRVGPASVVHPDDKDEVVRVFTQARAQHTGLSTSYRVRRARDGAYRWHQARFEPVRDHDGRITGWVGAAFDVDEQRRANDEQQYLLEATRVLGSSLDLARTLSDVARLVVPHLSDWAAIDLFDEARKEFTRAAVAHVDPSKVALAWDLWKRLPPRHDDPRGLAAVVRTGQPEHYEDIPDALLVASIPDPELLAIYRGLGLRSSMCVALVARGRALGAVTLVSAESGRRFGARDLAFAEEFARRIAIAVDNAQLYTAATEARTAAEAIAADVVEQSRAVEAALLAMRRERDAALAQLAEHAGGGSRGAP